MEEYILSLTGPDSHSIKNKPGQGSLSIGPKRLQKEHKLEVIVEAETPINWNAFNECFTPAGKKRLDLNPFGDWPRWFYYFGNDVGFGKWAEKRDIEYFTWIPQQKVTANFSKSTILELTIVATDHPINIIIGEGVRRLVLQGNIDLFHVEKVKGLENVSFYPNTDKRSERPYTLPNFEVFAEVTTVSISVSPIGQPFDCNGLLQFPKLKILNLSGNLMDLEALTAFKQLEKLALRYVPMLDDLPALASWDKLNSFIGWNIEESKGKLLRKELKELEKLKELNHSNVSKLKKNSWFTTEYGIPFDAWEDKQAKKAVKSYKDAVKKLSKVVTKDDAKPIIHEFTKTFNELEGMETTEREDVALAVVQLVEVPKCNIDTDTALQWFDEVRDY